MLRIVKLTLCVTVLAVSASSFATAEDTKKADEKKAHPIYGQTMKSLTGKETKLAQFRGKVMLIVNVASESGLEKTGPIRWNFEKILVSRNGKPVARFATGVNPDSEEVVKAIEAELAKEAPKKREKKAPK